MFIKPVRMPHVRDRAVQYLLRYGIRMFGDLAFKELPPGERLIRSLKVVNYVVDGLRDEHCELLWAPADFTQLVVEAAKDLPEAEAFSGELPAPSGLIIFDEPIPVLDRVSSHVGVQAVSWAAGEDGRVWVMGYASAPEMLAEAKMTRDAITAKYGWLLPVSPGSELRFGDAIPHNSWGVEVVRPLLATLLLMDQDGVTDMQVADRDKSLDKKHAKAGTRYPDVRVVNLRRRPVPEGRESPEAGRTYSVRWIVKGHWRDQAYGKGRGMRKRIYIAPHLKGPDEAPIKSTTVTVKKL